MNLVIEARRGDRVGDCSPFNKIVLSITLIVTIHTFFRLRMFRGWGADTTKQRVNSHNWQSIGLS